MISYIVVLISMQRFVWRDKKFRKWQQIGYDIRYINKYKGVDRPS